MLVTNGLAYLKLARFCVCIMIKFIRNVIYFCWMPDAESAKRQVAYKVSVADLLRNRYVKEEGWFPNYISVGDRKVSRANLLGVITAKQSQEGGVAAHTLILDDGTGSVPLRFFESAGIDVGDIVNVIGRPREFGADRYVVPEIIRKVSDSRWVQVRKLELASEHHSAAKPEGADGSLLVEEEDFGEVSSPLARVIGIVRDHDAGDGVGFEDVAVRAGDIDLDDCLKRLLEKGEIFEIRPGRYKVLE